mgnify:CR=1 FL=1
MLKIHNSLKREKQLFTPIEPNKVRMYVCGMTVYDYCHLGHARVMVVFDMVYRPRLTKLLQDAEEAGCRIIPGLEMLLFQAVLQFELWTGQKAPEAVMRNTLQRALQSDL